MPKSKSLDYIFLFVVLALSAVGTIMVFSASPTLGLRLGDGFYFIKRHLFYLLLGFLALYFGFRLDLELLKKRAGIIFVVSLALLLLVYVPGVGRKVLGASRWIELGILSFQPSELMKFTTLLYMANLLSARRGKIGDFFQGFAPPILLLAAVSALIVKQPDLGTALTITAASFIMLFAAGAELWHLGLIGALGILGITAISIASPYRLRRLLAYLDPWKDPQGIGFQIIQSLLAVGSGGLLGLGLGASRQKYFYLPQQFTDFIFAILCEELGFIGGVGVVVLFGLFAARGLKIVLATADPFKNLLAVGLVAWITVQALINIMVVVGLIPTTGIPLPFISYGGTATIVNFFAAGVILNISRQTKAG
ncbi:MAG: putative lipid II flippase FtsW [Candidatus Margulisbacteria bacterium]|nr:putative lipid II flippase FtsW [Candidatus Margulisiibacteriota bacterium]